MSNKKIFVDSNWVKNKMEDKNTVILDVPFGKYEYIKENDEDKRNYDEKHIPGAIKITMDEVSSKENDLNILSSEEIEKVFINKGINHETNLIVYSDGIIASSRIAFIAYWLGVENVFILKGGVNEWVQSGYSLTSEKTLYKSVEKFGVETPLRPEILISTPDDLINEKKSNDNMILASIRSWDEFTGYKSGYPYIEGSGSPQGAVYAKASTGRRNVDEMLTDDGQFGDLNQIFNEWEKWGLTSDKEAVFFCGAGWRAATVFFILLELGWDNIKVFDGGWYQYSKYHALNPSKYPIQIGDPRDEIEFRIINE